MPNPSPRNHRPVQSSRLRRLIGADLERCIFCRGTAITREGKRYKKLETVQLWYCRACDRVFTPQTAKGKTYPLKVILESLCLYYRGETRARVSKRIKERFGVTVPPRTLSTWLSEYRDITTYARLRDQCVTTFRPHQLIRSVRLHHQQVYQYRVHQGKLFSILNTSEHRPLHPIGDFLTKMAASCPHHLFQSDARASQGKAAFDLDAVEIKAKRNHACRLAGLVLQTVTHNKRRHDELQRFMLTGDSVTVAVEVPIYLTPEDIAHMQRQLGFRIPIEADTILTGHIDVLQIRNGAIPILDYKPGANKEKPITQLGFPVVTEQKCTLSRPVCWTPAWWLPYQHGLRGERQSLLSHLIQQTLCHLLHFIDRERAVHVHRGLVRLVPQKVLNPLRTEPFGFQKTSNGVAKQMGIEVGEARIGIHYSGLGTEIRHDAVDRPQRHRTMAIAEKDRPRFSTADEDEQITEILVIDDGNDPCFTAFALVDGHPFAFLIEVSHIEIDEFAATHAEPPEGFDQASIPEIAGAQEQFSHVSRLEVIGRGGKLLRGCRHGKTSLKMALFFFCVPKTAHNPSQEVNPLNSIR
jgi:hypothetical protein